jgi:PilZ domain-containing protein
MANQSAPHCSPRYLMVVPVHYEAFPQEGRAPKTGSGQTRDVSMTGACLELSDSLAVGTFLSLHLHFEADSLALHATVVWARADPPRGGTLHGVSFPQVAPAQRQGFQAFLLRSRPRELRVAMGQSMPVRARPSMKLQLLEIGVGGARVEHLAPLRPGFSCVLEFPPALGALVLATRVIRSVVVGFEPGPRESRRLRYESAVAFVDVTPSQQAALTQLLKQLSSGHSGESVPAGP